MGPTLCNPVLESRIVEQNTWRIEHTRLRPGSLECQRNSSCTINEDLGDSFCPTLAVARPEVSDVAPYLQIYTQNGKQRV
jgi:hypothetical protein